VTVSRLFTQNERSASSMLVPVKGRERGYRSGRTSARGPLSSSYRYSPNVQPIKAHKDLGGPKKNDSKEGSSATDKFLLRRLCLHMYLREGVREISPIRYLHPFIHTPLSLPASRAGRRIRVRSLSSIYYGLGRAISNKTKKKKK
jgi:hypothetical protein